MLKVHVHILQRLPYFYTNMLQTQQVLSKLYHVSLCSICMQAMLCMVHARIKMVVTKARNRALDQLHYFNSRSLHLGVILYPALNPKNLNLNIGNLKP